MIFDLPPPDPTLEISVASSGYSKGLAQTDGMQVLIRPESGVRLASPEAMAAKRSFAFRR